MGSYLPLFTVQVGHAYFSSGQWGGLKLVPTSDTARMMTGADILVRPTSDGMAVFYDTERARALRLYAQGSGQTLRFRFKVSSSDRSFSTYTAPTAGNGKAIPCFGNAGGFINPDTGALRLSQDEFASDKDLRDMSELVADGLLDQADLRSPPDFVLALSIKPPQDDGVPGTADKQSFYCNFAARSSLWRYFVMGNLGGNSPAIVDPDNRVEFEQREDVLLVGNRPARVFRSKDAIPLQEMPTCRFQLKAQGNGSARVLIKRLPAASKNRLGMDEIDGKKEIVFENYINF